ncbi:MAG: hypothetical protein O6757_07440, partial [Alphaproteobacteria bacterium]|nr:hypothetical protein [Alphaproteobacteria bacterium]
RAQGMTGRHLERAGGLNVEKTGDRRFTCIDPDPRAVFGGDRASVLVFSGFWRRPILRVYWKHYAN